MVSIKRIKTKAWQVIAGAGVFLLLSGLLRADIIDDINQLEKPKAKPKPETEEDKAIDEGSTTPLPPPPLPPTTTEKPLEIPKSESAPPQQQKAMNHSGGKLDKDARRKLPIHLASDGTSTYSQNGSIVELEKNVVITQEDVRLQADQAKVRLQKGVSNGVESAEMLGRVTMARYSKDPTERITARGDRAIFDNSGQVVTLDGNARLWRDGHLIKGDRIIYEIVNGTIKVDKVQGVVQPEKAGK